MVDPIFQYSDLQISSYYDFNSFIIILEFAFSFDNTGVANASRKVLILRMLNITTSVVLAWQEGLKSVHCQYWVDYRRCMDDDSDVVIS